MSKEEKPSAMQRANENFEVQREHLRQQGFEEKTATISIFMANVMALVLALPFFIVFIAVYIQIWGRVEYPIALRDSIWFLFILLMSIPVHELLHGLGWIFFCEKGYRSIRFGVMWSKLTPYCNCKEPLGFWQYITGGLLPFMVLGLIPCILAVIIGNNTLLLFGLFSIIAAGGDMTIVLKLLRHRKALFLDHPSECGFVAFYPPKTD